jgi:hypothetical protein
VLEDGEEAAKCANHARLAQEKLGEGVVMGFWADDNPDAALSESYDGHDFLLVRDRWIVDSWLDWIGHKQFVFDLENEDDARIAQGILGDRDRWEESLWSFGVGL